MRELKKLPYTNVKLAVMGSRDQFCLDNPTQVRGSALNELCGAKRRAAKKEVEYEADEDYKINDGEEVVEEDQQEEKKKTE